MAICNRPGNNIVSTNPNNPQIQKERLGHIIPSGQIPWAMVLDPQLRDILRGLSENQFSIARHLNGLLNKQPQQAIMLGGSSLTWGMAPAIVRGKVSKQKNIYSCDVYANGIGLDPTHRNVLMVNCDSNLWGDGLEPGDIILVAEVNVVNLELKFKG